MAPPPTDSQLTAWIQACTLGAGRQSRAHDWSTEYRKDPAMYQSLADQMVEHSPDMCCALTPTFLLVFPQDLQARLTEAARKATAAPATGGTLDGRPSPVQKLATAPQATHQGGAVKRQHGRPFAALPATAGVETNKRALRDGTLDANDALVALFNDEQVSEQEPQQQEASDAEPAAKKARVAANSKGSWESQKKAILRTLEKIVQDNNEDDEEFLLALGPERVCDLCFFHVEIKDNGDATTNCLGPTQEKARPKAGMSKESTKAEWGCSHCRHSLKRACSFKQFPKELPMPTATPLDGARLAQFEKWIKSEVLRKARKRGGASSHAVALASDEDEPRDLHQLLAEAKLLHVTMQAYVGKAREHAGTMFRVLERAERCVRAQLPTVDSEKNGQGGDLEL